MSSTGVPAPLKRLWNRARPARLFIRRVPEFWLVLAIRQAGFIRPPRDRQRGKLISRALRECTDELRHLHEIAPRFVRGAKTPRYDASLDRSPALYDERQLGISGHQVMMEWERPLMAAMAEIVTEAHGDVLGGKRAKLIRKPQDERQSNSEPRHVLVAETPNLLPNPLAFHGDRLVGHDLRLELQSILGRWFYGDAKIRSVH